MKTYHIYFNGQCLFKNLSESEFQIIWGRMYHSYYGDQISFSECVDNSCLQGKIEEHSY